VSDAAKISEEGQEWVPATHDGRTTALSAGAADRFQRPESYTANLQRQNSILRSEVTELHQQVRDLQLALVVEKALGAVDSRMRYLPSSGPVGSVAPTRKRP
jgi:hypothetical protein